MKIPLAAVTLVVAALGATPVNPPAARLEATATARNVIVVPPLDLNPHAVISGPVGFSSLREASASSAGTRLNHLDDRVSNLKARADLGELRGDLEQGFERLKVLRSNVATALLTLRDPTIGLDAAQYAVSTALNELELAIEELNQKLEQPRDPPRVS